MPFEIRGMEATIAQFKQLAAGSEEAAKRAVKYSAADGYYCEVKPVGNHSGTGEPLAKIGNVLEYGRSYGATKKAGLGWFHPTVKAAEGEVLAKIQAEFEKAQK